jgi:hypothetical protein
LRVGSSDGLGELLGGVRTQRGDRGFLPGSGVVALGLVLDGLDEGFEFVSVASDLGLDRLTGLELGGQFLDAFAAASGMPEV